MRRLILFMALSLPACAALPAPPPSAGFAVLPGPCGLEYQLTAKAGVPLSVPAGVWVVTVDAQGGATVTLTRACAAPRPQEADDGAGVVPR